MNNRKKILVVDDDEIHLAVTENILKREYEIITATSGKKALELLKQGLAPNLVLLDVLMPNMDGWEAYNRIKAISFLNNTPIAFASALQGEMEEEHAKKIGAVDFIPKPFKRIELLNRVEILMKKYEK